MFRSHRSAFLEHMADGDLALFLGARLAVRNHDVDYPFRQESGFWWLTGCPEPEAALILAKGIEGVAEETLFVLPRDPAKETWTGRRLGPEGAVESLGFAAGANVEDFPAQAQAAMAKAGRVWSRLGADPVLDELLREGQA
ncbi:MAG: aminopeptidase P N-terminal domain-containing protein, partial [Planctomycetota bacterium]